MRRLTNGIRRVVAAIALRSMGVMMLALALIASSPSLFAQGPVPTPAPPVTATRSWFLEAFIVVVMMGLALFVVCRSSRRN